MPLFLRVGMVLIAAALAAPAHAGSVRLQTSDQRTLSAEQGGTGKKGVLLVHDADRSRADWSSFATRLAENGFQVLALDLRGHGDSKAAEAALSDASWPAMTADVDAGVAWLRSHGAERVTVVGAALGANLALASAASGEGIDALVLLSPAISVKGVSVAKPIADWQGPLLVVGDARNPASSRAASLIADKAGEKAKLELVEAGAAGHRMLNTVPELEALIVGWINGARGEGAELASPDRDVRTGDPEKIETTGEQYGAKR